jgi:hypothetical protein
MEVNISPRKLAVVLFGSTQVTLSVCPSTTSDLIVLNHLKQLLINFFSRKGRPQLLAIENPDQPDSDIGRNSYMLPKIKRAFEHSHQLLTSALSGPASVSYLSFVIRSDDPQLISRYFDLTTDRGNHSYINDDDDRGYPSNAKKRPRASEEDLEAGRRDRDHYTNASSNLHTFSASKFSVSSSSSSHYRSGGSGVNGSSSSRNRNDRR